MKKSLKFLVTFWLCIFVILVSFMMAVISIAAGGIPHFVVTVFALVIFAASLAVAIINPGIFARHTTTATGD